jgi:hypothetical protein
MPEPLQLVIGSAEHERVVVEVLGRERPDSLDADDGNWILSHVSVESGGFHAQFTCSLRAEDFAAFLPQLQHLVVDPRGAAQFRTMEEQLELDLQGDGLGHFDVQGQAVDRCGTGNTIGWSQTIDQSDLLRLIASVAAISTAYNVRGRMSN